MTQDEIIEMARQAGLPEAIIEMTPIAFEAFAKLVAQHTLANIDPSKFISFQEGVETGRLAEREACAQVCEKFVHNFEDPSMVEHAAVVCAKAIRARGQA